MIVTVSIRRENDETSKSVSQSLPTKTTGVYTATSAVRNAILDAGVAAIVEATREGWLD